MPSPLRQETEFERGGNVIARAGEEKRERRDVFELEKAFPIDAGGARDGIAGLKVLPFAAAGNEIAQDAALFPGEIESVARGDPVTQPRLQRNTFAADGVAQQIAVVGVAVGVIEIPVVEVAVILEGGETRAGGRGVFEMQIPLRQKREVREVNARADHTFRDVLERNEIVVVFELSVECRPVVKFGKTPSPVDGGARIARDAVFGSIDATEEAFEEKRGRERMACAAN